MAYSKPPTGWSVVEVLGGWAIVDELGARLAFVAGEDHEANSSHQVMSKLEAWHLASCIAALPQILLQQAKSDRQKMPTATWSGMEFRMLYNNLMLN